MVVTCNIHGLENIKYLHSCKSLRTLFIFAGKKEHYLSTVETMQETVVTYDNSYGTVKVW